MSQRIPKSRVIARLRALLGSGSIGPQEQLPPERDLAAQLGCSRETLRRALRDLESERLIWRHQGKGTFIGPRPAGQRVSVDRVIESATNDELMDARLVYEPALAAAAARQATAAQITELRGLAVATGKVREWRDYEQIDDAFHKAIAQASGNPLLSAIFLTLASTRDRARWQRGHDLMFRKEQRAGYAARQSALHLEIVEAIAHRNEAAAFSAMVRHLDEVRRLMKSENN